VSQKVVVVVVVVTIIIITRNQYASPPEGNAIPAGPLGDFLSDFYKIRHGEGVPGP